MLQGKIKWFNVQKGYGFIYSKTLGDLFFHVSYAEGFEFSTGDLVEFILMEGRQGRQAGKVVKL